jgi:hypothetical protein
LRPPEQTICAASGREPLLDALSWIAEDHPLNAGTDLHELLQALATIPETTSELTVALRRVAREVAKSRLDTATVLFSFDNVTPPAAFRRALDALAWKSPTGTLTGLTADSVLAAQRACTGTIQALCAMAGISIRDLRDRVSVTLPADPRGAWNREQVSAAFEVVDGIVRGTEATDLEGALPARPLELFFQAKGGPVTGSDAWDAVEQMRRGGTPFELLLAQREAGGAWLAHRNSTSQMLSTALAEQLCSLMGKTGVSYRRASSVGGHVTPSDIRHMVGGGGQVGIVVLGADSHPVAAVTFSVARDGGTASKNASRLINAGGVRVPTFLVVAGPGWADRNETADLAVAFNGRVFADHDLNRLVADLTLLANGDGPV